MYFHILGKKYLTYLNIKINLYLGSQKLGKILRLHSGMEMEPICVIHRNSILK
jgi:hypothetical protein